ncbi:MAG TPA: PAS domain S-box protein [Terriglobales bacterium]|nr:PAS domain S-box protein [Terriglobales bacterium]
MRILLVDDQEPVRRGLRSLLSSRTDWLVCGEAVDGLEAVEKAKTLRPNVVLMDISMPRMNGLEATRIIRQEVPESQVILISQNDPTIVDQQAAKMDVRGYVVKADLSRDLLPAIDRLVGRRGVESSNPDGNKLSSVSHGLGFTKSAPLRKGGENIIDSAVFQMGSAADTPLPDGEVSLESILCTEELHRRPSRPPDHEKENRALVALAQALADSPGTILQTLADTILEVFQADSAGLSLLTTHDGGKRFYWPAIAGRWNPHIGGGTPRNFGPCGDVLDRNIPLLFRHFERRYTYFQPITPPAEECLLVPFYVEGKAVGTIWAIAHDDRRKFDAEDERLLSSLGKFASSAYQIHGALESLELQEAERKSAERVTGLLAAIVDSSDDAIVSKSLDGFVTSWNKSAERLFGYTAEEAVGQHITLIVPADRRHEESTILEQLKRGKRVDHFETVRMHKDGKMLDVSLTISPVKDAAGSVVGASKVARDITERKRTERALNESEERLRTLADGLETQVRVRTQELEQRNTEVLQQSEQLRELSNRLLQTQDDERRRIARELHDSAGQIVTALGLNLASITHHLGQDPLIGKAVEESRELIQQLSKEIRTMSYLLHPPLLDENGLLEAIRWYMQGLTERSGLNIELTISENFGRLAGEIELAVFRIVQECLTNIHRHSASKTATIRLSRTAESVSLQIQDEGKGISAEMLARIQAQRSGVGITGIRERVRHFRGVMDIQSSGRGTKISVTFPILMSATSEPKEILQQSTAATG